MVQLDDCGRDMSALAQALRFIPVSGSVQTCVNSSGGYNGTDPYQRGTPTDILQSPDQTQQNTNDIDQVQLALSILCVFPLSFVSLVSCRSPV